MIEIETGTILWIGKRGRFGVLRVEDGKDYPFKARNIASGVKLKTGQCVEFLMVRQNHTEVLAGIRPIELPEEQLATSLGKQLQSVRGQLVIKGKPRASAEEVGSRKQARYSGNPDQEELSNLLGGKGRT